MLTSYINQAMRDLVSDASNVDLEMPAKMAFERKQNISTMRLQKL